MSTNYLNDWAERSLSRTRIGIIRKIEIKEHYQRFEPERYASISMTAEPSSGFRIDISLSEKATSHPHFSEFISETVFGILDILFTHEDYPVLDVRLTIHELHIDPLSTLLGFRMVGRRAALSMLTYARDKSN